jgi:hypothetical protein
MMPFPTSSGDLATALALLTVGVHSVIAARASRGGTAPRVRPVPIC